MKICFVGGGSLGPVTPLLATWSALRRMDATAEAMWIGTEHGPERALVECENISFFSLPTAKWPRYFSIEWIRFPWRWLQARLRARRLMETYMPDVVVSVGGFTAVPVVLAAKQVGVPIVIHQLDREPGLANKLCAPFADSVTSSFMYDRPPFGRDVRVDQISTPTRFSLERCPPSATSRHMFDLIDRPTILIMGGGTGARALNEHVEAHVQEWLALGQVIHITGLGKCPPSLQRVQQSGYVVRELLEESDLAYAYAAATVIVSRAGMGALSDIAALMKPSVLVPIPSSQQEKNAEVFKKAGAAHVVSQRDAHFAEHLLSATKDILQDAHLAASLGERAHLALPTDNGTTLARRILRVAMQNHAAS